MDLDEVFSSKDFGHIHTVRIDGVLTDWGPRCTPNAHQISALSDGGWNTLARIIMSILHLQIQLFEMSRRVYRTGYFWQPTTTAGQIYYTLTIAAKRTGFKRKCTKFWILYGSNFFTGITKMGWLPTVENIYIFITSLDQTHPFCTANLQRNNYRCWKYALGLFSCQKMHLTS